MSRIATVAQLEALYGQPAEAATVKEVARITRETYARVQEVLARRRDDLERLAQRLLETEVLEGEELKQLLYGATAALQPARAATATA